MDASEWADFKTSTPEPNQAQPTAAAPNAPTGPQPSDWADFNPQPGYAPLIQPPAALAARLQAGQAVGNTGAISKMGKTFSALWGAAKEGAASGFSAGADAEGLSKQWEQNRQDLVKMGLDRNPAATTLLNTAQALQGTFALMGGAFNGVVGAAGSVTGEGIALSEGLDPVQAQQKREDYAQNFMLSTVPITMELGMNPMGHQYALARVMHNSPLPGGLDPAFVSKNGEIARLRQTADGSVEAQSIGQPPTPDKFQQAAQIVASLNPHATPEELQTKLINLWNNYGYHPAEAVEHAQESPTAAHELATGPDVPPMRNNDYEAALYHKQNEALTDSLGPTPTGPEAGEADVPKIGDWLEKVRANSLSAAATPQMGQAPITSAFIRAEDDNLFRLMQNNVANTTEMLHSIKDMGPHFRTPEGGERLYRYMEGDPDVQLTPAEEAEYQKNIVPLRQQERELWEEVKKYNLDISDYDPSYVHRMVKGKNAVFDRLSGDGSVNANPISGGKLPQSTSSMRQRTFYTMEDAAGNRQLIEIHDGVRVNMLGPNGVSKPLAHPLNNVDVGSKLQYQGKDWEVKSARTSEIEGATDVRYYKNGLANTAFNVLNLKAVRQAIFEIERLKDTPEFQTNAIPIRPGTNYRIPDTHSVPQMPLLSNYALPRHLTEVLDDFYGKRGDQDLGDVLNKVGRIAVQSMFWTPIGHMGNVAVDAAVTRGFDNFTPAGLKSFMMDLPKAIHQVVTQGPDYIKFMREGSGLAFGRVSNKDAYAQIMHEAGMDIVRNPAKWDPIARTLGIGPSNLIPMFYNNMSKVLFVSSDVLMMQRLYELQRKGMDLRAAISDAERTMANYRMPPRLMGSRFVQKFVSNPAAFEFSRYHIDQMKFVAVMARDLAVGTPEQKLQTMGRIMTLALIMGAVYPAISWGLDKLTGDPNLKWGNFGVSRFFTPLADYAISHNKASVPDWVSKYYDGNTDFARTIQSTLSPSPILREGLEFGTNHKFFTGGNVAEPGDWKNGNLPAVAGQEAGNALGNLVQPYSLLDQAQRPGETLWHTILTEAIAAHSKTERQQSGQAYGNYEDQRNAAKRHMRSTDIIEQAIQAAEKATGSP